jgi:hypothetical protein
MKRTTLLFLLTLVLAACAAHSPDVPQSPGETGGITGASPSTPPSASVSPSESPQSPSPSPSEPLTWVPAYPRPNFDRPDNKIEYYWTGGVNELIILADIAGREEAFAFFRDVVEKEGLDASGKTDFSRLWMREGIEYFGITKEAFIAANEENKRANAELNVEQPVYSDHTIDALFLEDREERIAALLNPNVLYRDGVFVNIYELFAMSAEERARTGFTERELLDFSHRIYDTMEEYETAGEGNYLGWNQPAFDALWAALGEG